VVASVRAAEMPEGLAGKTLMALCSV
jgi:hypothetical protein